MDSPVGISAKLLTGSGMTLDRSDSVTQQGAACWEWKLAKKLKCAIRNAVIFMYSRVVVFARAEYNNNNKKKKKQCMSTTAQRQAAATTTNTTAPSVLIRTNRRGHPIQPLQRLDPSDRCCGSIHNETTRQQQQQQYRHRGQQY